MVIGSVSLALITTFIYENQQEFDNQKMVTEWVQNQLTNYCFLYQKAEGDDMNVSHNVNLILVLILSTKKWWGLFHSGSIIGTFVAHLMAAQGARRVPELEVESKRPTYDHSYSALAFSAAGVSQLSCFYYLLKIQHNIYRFSMLSSFMQLTQSLFKWFAQLASHQAHC